MQAPTPQQTAHTDEAVDKNDKLDESAQTVQAGLQEQAKKIEQSSAIAQLPTDLDPMDDFEDDNMRLIAEASRAYLAYQRRFDTIA